MVEDALLAGHPAHPWVGERLQQLGQGVRGPDRVAVHQHHDLTASSLDADPDRVALAGNRRPRPLHASGELVTDGLKAGVSGAVDDDDRLVWLLLGDETQHSAEQLEWLVDDGDDHADGGSVGDGPGSVAAGEQDLDRPQDPDGGHEHGEEVDWMATLQRVAEL
jgi:hypothetical protein